LRFLVPACVILLCLYYWRRQTEEGYRTPIPLYDDSIFVADEPSSRSYPYAATKPVAEPASISHHGLPPYGDAFSSVKAATSTSSAAQKSPTKAAVEASATSPKGSIPTPAKATGAGAAPTGSEKEDGTDDAKDGAHPIDTLISRAEKRFSLLLETESHSLADAAAAYRTRRGRHPPPGFDVWYKFAKEKKAIVVEEFWDQIYHDLNPFWALPAALIRKEAVEFEMTINIRNGNATAGSDWFWTQIWLKLIKTIEHMLPDMDLALNAMDEPRIVVPWETMDRYMGRVKAEAKLAKPKLVVSDFKKLPKPREDLDDSVSVRDKKFEQTSK